MTKARDLASAISTLATTTDTAALAPKASPTFTGDAKAVTPAAGDSDTSIPTTAFVTSAIATAVSALTTAIGTAVGAIPGGIGVGQTYASVTLAKDTARQNTTGKPILVVIELTTLEIGSTTKSYPEQTLSVSANGSSSWVSVGTSPNGVKGSCRCSAIITPGHYYRWSVATSGSTAISIVELS